jgi:UPF0755 protein
VQIDELDLAWDDDADPGRHRHRRSSARKSSGKGRAGRSFVALFISLVVLAALGAGVYFGIGRIQGFFSAPDYNSGGTGEVVIEVKDGDTATAIAQTLVDKGVVKSAKAFVEAAKANERSKTIQPGFYKLRQQMRARDALSLMLDPTSKLVNKVLLREGLTYKASFEALSKGTGIPVDQFEAAAKDPVALGVPAFWFNRDDGKPATKSIEGFLFPDTYGFGPNVTATDVLKKVVARFLEVAAQIDLVNVAQGKSVMPFQALVNASLIQAEAGTQADMPKVGRVIYNRLNKKMPLEFDSTTNYWRELHGQERKHNLTDAELADPTNPYRTYGVLGLPPGPIGNPGKDSLLAAINPTPNQPWLYFVRIDKAGNSAFTDSYQQHLKNIETAKKNGAY